MKKLRVTIEGKVYEVLVEVLEEGSAPTPAAPPQPTATRPLETAAQAIPAPATPAPAAAPAPAPSGATDVPSPLAGKVVSVDVKVGQTVEEGAQIATIEAMKMNTYIFAPKAGRVETIFAQAGDGVEEGTVLLRLV
jgi:biotin carboxyl carrier protein